MNTTTLHRAIGLVLAPFALAACGGGGGGGIVRSSPPPVGPPPAAPPPAPPAAAEAFCPAPITSDCAPDLPYTLTFDENQMKGGRDTEFGLRIRENFLTLIGDYRFGAGTTIEKGGALIVDGVLRSNTTVENGGELWLRGTLRGDLTNAGRMLVGQTKLDPQSWETTNRSMIEGNFTQQAGTLSVTIGMPLRITGLARIEGSILEFRSPVTQAGTPILPSTSSHQVLHADAGVFGTFDRWTSPGLFIEGSLRYGSNDVWFDLTRISLLSAMSGQGVGGITLASAANLDRALAIADGFAAAPDTMQSRFLRSAGHLLWLDDAQQAARSLDSLAGVEHAQLATDAQARASAAAARLAMHAGKRRMDGLPSHWSLALAGGGLDGYDQWIGPRTLVGGSVAREATAANGARSNEQRASLYLHHRGDRWQGAVVASAGRGNSLLQRRIDFGDERVHVAGTQRRIDLAQLHAELARPLAWARGELQPYTAIDAGLVRGNGFLEQGDTGFELSSQGGALHQLGAVLGLRYMRDWRIGAQRVQLLADLQRTQRLRSGGQWQAAFLGVTDAAFDLRDWSDPRSHSARVSLQGGAPGGWQWAFSGLRDGHRGAATSLQLRFGRDF